MRRLLLFVFAAVAAFATDPSIGYLKYWQWGPDKVFPGHTFMFEPVPMYSVTLDCRASDSTCGVTDGGYVPDGTERFYLSEQNLTAGGFPATSQFPLGNLNGYPAYYAVNVDGTTHRFNLVMGSRYTVPEFAETRYVASAGTPTNPAVPLCNAAGTYPTGPYQVTVNSIKLGLFFTGNGSTHDARFQVTVDSGGNITGTAMIDGGGNFTSMPATGTVGCLDSGGTAHSYSVAFPGGTLRTYIPITSDGNVTLCFRGGGHITTRPWLADVCGKGWPTGTTMTYWYGGTSYAYAYLKSGVPAANCATVPSGVGMTWLPNIGYDGVFLGVEVSIPGNAPLGPISAGWTFCNFSGGACADVLHNITVSAIPDYPLAPPTPVALPTAFDPSQATAPCRTQYPNATPTNSSNCSFFHLITSVDENGYGNWWPTATRGATAPNNPDYNKMEYSTACTGGPCYITYGDAGSSCPLPSCGYFYDFARNAYWIASWTGDNSWLNVSRQFLSHYGQVGPGVPNIKPWSSSTLIVPSPYSIPYNTAGTTPYSQSIMWAIHPWGAATNLATFNSGKYTTSWVRQWSAEMASVLYRNAMVASTPSLTPGDTSFMGLGFPFGAGASAITIDSSGGMLASSSHRWLSFEADTKIQVAKALNPPRYTCSGTPATCTLTPFGLQFKLITEAIQTAALQFMNGPASNGPYEIGPVADQIYIEGGLFPEMLIDHYQLTKDPLDLHLIHGMIAYLYPFYHSDTHTFPQVTANNGPMCYGGGYYQPNRGWYSVTYLGGGPGTWCNDDMTNYLPYAAFNGMSSYAAAWWWARFGGADIAGSSNAFAAYADNLAVDSLAYDVSAVPGPGLRYAPKGSNEQYGRYGFRYFTERQQRGSW